MAKVDFAEGCQRVIAAYMDAFNSRNMDTLGAVLTEDVELVDWDISARGKANVLETTRKIVSGASLHITVRGMIIDGSRVVADLAINIDGKSELAVLDLFEITAEGLICSIRAFRGQERRLS